MTSGIYSLVFADTYVYIGKSINIENRWKQHWDKMSSGKAAKNVQEAFDRYGEPKASIIVECHPDHIDILETIAISKNSHLPLLNSASTVDVSEADAALILKNGNLIVKSTPDHIREILNLRNMLEEQASTLEEYDRKGMILPKGIAEIRSKNKQLETELASAATAVRYWKAEAQKSWWQRLFS